MLCAGLVGAGVGCARSGSPAQRYAAALSEADYARAFALCEGIGGMEIDCQNAVIDRFGRYVDCDRLRDPDECHFLHAEHLARVVGDIPAGVRECRQAGRFTIDCNEHLIGVLAMGGDTIADASRNFDEVEKDLAMKSARGHFFRGWFHERHRRGISPDIEECPDLICKNAGRYEARLAEKAGSQIAP